MKKVKVIFPDGSTAEIDESELQSALAAGAKRVGATTQTNSAKSTSMVFPDGSIADVDEKEVSGAMSAGAVKKNNGSNGTPAVSNTLLSAIDPTQQFETINTPNGVSFSIDKTKIPAPLNTPEFVSQTQQRINDGIILPQDEEAIALGTGKKIKAVSAYLQGDNKTGYSVDRMDLVEKNRNNLTKIIEDYNTKNNESIIPEALLADPDKLSAWAQMYKAKIEKEIRNNIIKNILNKCA